MKTSTTIWLLIAVFPETNTELDGVSDEHKNEWIMNEWMDGWMNLFIWKHFRLKKWVWASLVAQWIRIHLPMQGIWVRSLVREDSTCHGATKPVRHDYWAHVLQPLTPTHPRTLCSTTRGASALRSPHTTTKSSSPSLQLGKVHTKQRARAPPKTIINK